MTQRDSTMEEVIDYLILLLGNQFKNSVNHVYFGDIGVYLPQAFGGSRREQKAVLALSAEEDEPVDGTKTASHENRWETINIIGIVNITPYFEASPTEAYAERNLLRLMTQIRQFLNKSENENLQGRVAYTRVGRISWAWVDRGTESTRTARLEYQFRIREHRLEE